MKTKTAAVKYLLNLPISETFGLHRKIWIKLFIFIIGICKFCFQRQFDLETLRALDYQLPEQITNIMITLQ